MFLYTHGIISSASEPPFNTKSLRFDGALDYVDAGNVLGFERTDSFSISLWFRRDNYNTTEFLISKQDSTSNSRGYTILIPSNDNRLTVVIRNNTASSGRLIVDSTVEINDITWHHMVMTYDGSSTVGGITLYLDGSDVTGVTSGTLSSTILNSANFNIGAKNGSNTFQGNIDEVSIFDSELSSSDVTSIYNSGEPNDVSILSNIVSFFRMGDNDTYPTVSDNVGSNDGTMINMTSSDIVSNTP